jgi:nicotinate phosphoribosyltransferase
LGALRFSCDVDAMPEGTAAFAHEPLLRIRGPLLQCQLLETSLLNVINFSTLIATKAARIASVAGESTLLEFGLRRARDRRGDHSGAGGGDRRLRGDVELSGGHALPDPRARHARA